MTRRLRSSNGWGSELVAAVMATVVAWAPLARAQDAPDAPEPVDMDCVAPEALEGPRRRATEQDGVVGFWFRRDVALHMICELRVAEQLRPRVRLLERQLEIRDAQVERLRQMYDLAAEGEERALGVVDTAQRDARRAREELDAWYRHPILWTVVGIALGGFAVWLGAQVAGTTSI